MTVGGFDCLGGEHEEGEHDEGKAATVLQGQAAARERGREAGRGCGGRCSWVGGVG